MNTEWLNKEYKYFSLDNLKSILRNNPDKIVKILKMNDLAITNDLSNILEAINNKNIDIVKNKAHTLKSKFGYLGIKNMQEKSRIIELEINSNNIESIKTILKEINEYWKKAKEEINKLIESIDK